MQTGVSADRPRAWSVAIALCLCPVYPVSAGDIGQPPVEPVQAWELQNECGWWLNDADGKSLRVSIGQGDDGLVLNMADPIFMTLQEDDLAELELEFDGDAGRRVSVQAWVTHGPEETSLIGFYLDREGVGKLAGASSLALRSEGSSIVVVPMRHTPQLAELESCIPNANGDYGDEE